ncbi:uncharacterized protein LOC124990676 [Sciurus carolinensis]|uniref:uncharacterized protein LOC124990676 n=1 Tax=Sciurus carolinensis TaxID=30640 RepID=UPI001FB28746|nr:uncharacterized protein LOC124990676 [Sciurus carolinensis]
MGQTEETPQGQRGNASQEENTDVSQSQKRKPFQGQSREAPQGENKGTPQRGNSPKGWRKEIGQGQDMKTLQSWEGTVSQTWEAAQGEAPVGAQCHRRDSCKSLGEETPQCGERDSLGRRGRTTQRIQVKSKCQSQKAAEATVKRGAARDGAWAPLPVPRSPAWLRLPGPGAGMLAALSTEGCGQQGLPVAPPGGGHRPAEQEVGKARLPGTLRESRGGPGGPKASKAAWPAPPGGEKAPAGVSAAQRETALQWLLELHGAARRRRRREREQQRLRVRSLAGRPSRLRPAGGRAERQADCRLSRSWNGCAWQATATAGFILWGSLPVPLSSRHRQDPGRRQPGLQDPARGRQSAGGVMRLPPRPGDAGSAICLRRRTRPDSVAP